MSTLIDVMLRPMSKREPIKIPDGEGGSITTWIDAAYFNGVVSAEKVDKTRRGEHDEPTRTGNLTTRPDAPTLKLHDVIRDNHGRTWRVIGEGYEFPSAATMNYKRYKIESWGET